MSNTLDSNLIVDILAEQAMNTLPDYLAPLRVFSTDFSNERSTRSGSGPRQTIQVELNKTAGAVLENPTNFEVTAAEDTAVTVTMDHISRPVGLSVQDLNQGRRLMTKATKAVEAVANGVMDKVMALVTAATFDDKPVIDVTEDFADTFDHTVLKAMWASLSNGREKNAVLNGQSYSQFLPKDLFQFDPTTGMTGLFGFDNFTYTNRFQAAGDNVVAFSCDPSAMAVAAMLPADPGDAKERDYIASEVVTLDRLGISVEFNVWFSRATRGHWLSYDVVFGAAVGDKSALQVVTQSSLASTTS